MPEVTEVPVIVAFAARYWGGEGVRVTERPTCKGRRDVDGGAPTIPAGWRWTSDGFVYLAYMEGDELHWTDGSPWGSFGVVHDRGDHWLIEGWGDPVRVPK